jgi:hypothetical protein
LSIKLTLPKPMYGSMDLLDMQGRIALPVFTDETVGEGEHHLSLDGSQLPKGVYFLRFLTVSDRQVVCKVVKN